MGQVTRAEKGGNASDPQEHPAARAEHPGAALHCRNLECRRGGFSLQVEHLSIKAGEKIALLGENGCGKTTLFQALAGLLPFRGNIEFIAPQGEGERNQTGREAEFLRWERLNPEERARHMAYLPQEAGLLFNLTVNEVLALTLAGQRPLQGEARAAALRAAAMEDFLERPFQALSGGEKRRVMLARVLCRGCVFTLLDEPTAPLDMRHATLFMRHAARIPGAVLAAMHDVSLALRYFQRFLLMKEGRILYDVAKEELATDMLETIYGIGLERCGDLVMPEL